jgi:hypothetical protein
VTPHPHEITALARKITDGIGSDDEDVTADDDEALDSLVAITEEACSDVERLRDAIYNASQL